VLCAGPKPVSNQYCRPGPGSWARLLQRRGDCENPVVAFCKAIALNPSFGEAQFDRDISAVICGGTTSHRGPSEGRGIGPGNSRAQDLAGQYLNSCGTRKKGGAALSPSPSAPTQLPAAQSARPTLSPRFCCRPDYSLNLAAIRCMVRKLR
jgi:hypothetical protein